MSSNMISIKNLPKKITNNAATAATAVAKNAPASQPNKTFIIIVLVGIGLFALLGLIGFIMQQTSNGRVNSLDKKSKEQGQEIKDLKAKIQSAGSVSATNMKRGDQGPPGIQGPPGPTGGIHAGAGPLLCVGQKKVATPTVGTSQYSIIYLDDRRYTPIQYWTMRNNPDGTVSVVNKFTGNCMTTNNLGDVFSDTCRTPVPLTQKFNWGPNMQLSSADKQNFCVTVDNFDMNTSNSNNKYDLNNMTEKKSSNSGSVNQLKLKSCSQSQNLDQTWWVGN